MRKLAFAAVALLALNASGRAQDLKCHVGPVTKNFGGATWSVYACDDGKSIAMVTPSDSKAFPFFFGIAVLATKIDVHGEGTGNKAITDRAAKEIQALRLSDIQNLRQEAVAAAKGKP